AINQRDKIRIKENQNEVNMYNKTMTLGMLHISIAVLILPILASPFLEYIFTRVMICSSSIVILFTTLVLCKKGYFDKHPLIGIYITIITGSFLTIFLSVFASPDQRATILLGAFCIIPIVYIDCFKRKIFFSLSILIVHTIFAFYFKKPSLVLADTLNSVSLISLGSFLGHIMQQTNLTSFELKKNLIFERETDILTGLKNRRKMVELFTSVREKDTPTPCCAVLLDIDHFKQYNDIYGHTAGDELLHALGKILLSFEAQYNIKFYRYGGEEFSAFLWGYSSVEQAELLEQIRTSVENMKMKNKTTVSIGYMTGVEQSALNIETTLTFADSALYKAKNNGRNQVVCYDSSLSSK
ncbi:MAG: GGDEF domain-containing protein, partial [Anaerotignaceae bacterium]